MRCAAVCTPAKNSDQSTNVIEYQGRDPATEVCLWVCTQQSLPDQSIFVFGHNAQLERIRCAPKGEQIDTAVQSGTCRNTTLRPDPPGDAAQVC